MITLRHRKSGLAVASAAAALGCLLVGPSVASANNVDCWGAVGPTAKQQRDLTYSFACSDSIKSFSIVSNLEVGEFSTTADVIDPATNTPVDGETFGCEGNIPSDGFGCSGNANPPHSVTGTLSLDEARCVKRRNQLNAWVVAVDTAGTATGPFRLVVPRCPKVAKAKRAHHTRR